MIDKTVN